MVGSQSLFTWSTMDKSAFLSRLEALDPRAFLALHPDGSETTGVTPIAHETMQALVNAPFYRVVVCSANTLAARFALWVDAESNYVKPLNSPATHFLGDQTMNRQLYGTVVVTRIQE